MANKRAKLSDIAREAGVSLTAASFYINGKAKQYKLSPATCERLEAAVRKYDYVPNLFARAMQQNRTFLIGLLVRDRINSSFWNRKRHRGIGLSSRAGRFSCRCGRRA